MININIYSNKTYSAGETERFAYFGKYFYEQTECRPMVITIIGEV